MKHKYGTIEEAREYLAEIKAYRDEYNFHDEGYFRAKEFMDRWEEYIRLQTPAAAKTALKPPTNEK